MNAAPLCALALLALTPPAAADTLVVDDDGGPGVDFTDIQPAVTAAGEHDTILVHDGTYGAFVVDGKSVTVRASGAGALVTGTVRLRDGDAGTVMRLVGLDVSSDEKAVVVQDAPGAVSITDCELRGGHAANELWPGDSHQAYVALELLDAAGVVLLRSVAIGGSGASVFDEDLQTAPTSGAQGLRAVGATVFAYECTFEGGWGGSAFDTICDDGGDGGDGAQLLGGYLYAEACTFRGRDGGFADCCCFFTCCGDGGRGGDGLRLVSGAPTAEHSACSFAFGAGGGALGGAPGSPGQPVRVFSGTATEVPALVPAVCSGDGSGAACPCGNAGAPGAGCANSAGAGALLSASGTTSVVLDDLALHAAQAPPLQTAIFIQGATLVGDPFRDGILCAGAPIVRLQAVTLDAAGAASTTIDVAASAGLAPGDTRSYQLWYRDPTGPCGTGSNLSGALLATWR